MSEYLDDVRLGPFRLCEGVAVYLRRGTTVQDLEVAFGKPSSDKVDLSDEPEVCEDGLVPLLRKDPKPEVPSLSEVINRVLKSAELMLSAFWEDVSNILEEDRKTFVEEWLIWQRVLLEVHQLSDLQVAALFSRYQKALKPVWDSSDHLDLPCHLPNLGGSFSLISTVDLDESESDITTNVNPEVSVLFDLVNWSGKFEIHIDTLRTVLEYYISEAVEGLLFVNLNQG